jgi:4-O-beta-D-mannosyl-D-glucose phosphorylase
MKQAAFRKSVLALLKQQEKLLTRRNRKLPGGNGIYERYEFPVLTAAHAPIAWRYDLEQKTNPFLMERIGVNAVFNAGAILHEGKFLLSRGSRAWIANRFSRWPRARMERITFASGTIRF